MKVLMSLLVVMLLAVTGACAGTLERIYIVPGDVGLVVGSQQQFQVIGEDADGNEVSLPDPVSWQILSGSTDAGSIDTNGLFTAGNKPGLYRYAIMADCGYEYAYANIEVLPKVKNSQYILERYIGSTYGGRFNAPLDVQVTIAYVYVLSPDRVEVYNTTGYLQQEIALRSSVASAELAVDENQNIYVLNKDNCRVQKYSSAGSFVKEWGSPGSGPAQFNQPNDIAACSSRVYVADSGNNRIQVFDQNGVPVDSWPIMLRGQYDEYPASPRSIATACGHLTVTVTHDTSHSLLPEVQIFDSEGILLSRVDVYDIEGGELAHSVGWSIVELAGGCITNFSADGYLGDMKGYIPNRRWGHFGREIDMFSNPTGLASDGTRFYVSDYDNCRIQIVGSGSPDNHFNSWASAGNLKGQFKYPSAVSVDAQGNVLVGDSGNNRIQKFDAQGTFIREFGSQRAKDSAFACAGGITLGPTGNVHVADSAYSRILGYNSNGVLMSSWPLSSGAYGIAYNPSGYFYVTDPNSYAVITLNSGGVVLGPWGGFDTPIGVAVDSQRMNLIADYGYNCILRFNAGSLIGAWGMGGTGPGQFQGPAGICVDSQDAVYVADSGNCRIQKFNLMGDYLGQLGSMGYGAFELMYPESVAVDALGNLYVADTQNHRICKYAPYRASTTCEVKLGAGGGGVQINGAVVTAAFPDFFYIESDDRSSGIRVNKTNHGMSVGMRASITGTSSTVDGERCITAATVVQAGSGSVEPIALSNAALGGGDWKYDSVSGAGQCGIAGANGLNNLGLLVRTLGRVTHTGSGFFYIDDGSGLDDGSGYAGVKVLVNGFALPYAGAYVQATGISSCYGTQAGLQRLLRTRTAADVVVLSGTIISGRVTQPGTTLIPTLVESEHPYSNNFNYTWTIAGPPSATRMRVHFSSLQMEYNHDYLYLLNGAGVQQARYNTVTTFPNYWSQWVNGNTIKLKLTSDASGTRYGFQVDAYEVEGALAPVSGVTLTLMPSGLSTVTDANGEFSFTVSQAGAYTVTPSLAGATFTPSSRTFTVTAGQVVTEIDFSKN